MVLIQRSEVIAKDAIEHALAASHEFEVTAINFGASKSGAKKWSTQLKKNCKRFNVRTVIESQ